MTDVDWMARALALAERGRGAVEPNPLVGAVLVAGGTVVGEGFHARYGGPHAEVVALAAACDAARGATLYVTLEPCSHWGKTPPCADAVIRAGVTRVVAAMADPFPAVAGAGLMRLRDAGIIVEVDLLELEARRLNAPFLTRVLLGRPYVIAKWAMTLDGRIAAHTGHSKWITNAASRARAHALRGRCDAVVVGRGTLVADDPELTARPPGPRVPLRVVLSRSGDLPESARMLDTLDAGPVLVATAAPPDFGHLPRWQARGAAVWSSPDCGPASLLAELYRRGATNVLVEGGAGVLGAFRDADLIDAAEVFVAPKIVGGAAAPGPVGGVGLARVPEGPTLLGHAVEVLDGDVWISGPCRGVPA